MRKILFLFFLIAVIFCIIIFVIKDKLNITKILENIENDSGISIKLQKNQKWSYYPKLTYLNKLSVMNKNWNLVIKDSNISITRDYGINSPFEIYYQSPSIFYKGVNFRDSKIESEYSNKVLILNKFTADLIDGNIEISGHIPINDDDNKISLKGSYNNISINRILKQLNISKWERVNIKLSSPNFSLYSINDNPKEIIKNLNGEMNINGSVFFVSKEEERFGTAFLSLLADKFINIQPLSQSLTYILDKFADVPSNISGLIKINEGIVTTEKLLINNNKEKALLTASLNLNSNIIDGKIDLYKGDIIFLTTELKGNINNPEILIGGKIFTNDGKTKTQNIKKIFEEGIKTLVDNMLNLND